MSRPQSRWWGYVRAIIRNYPNVRASNPHGITLMEKQAVESAINHTATLNNGAERLRIVDMVFFRQTHQLAGAAMSIPCSYSTAKRWQREFIRQVAYEFFGKIAKDEPSEPKDRYKIDV